MPTARIIDVSSWQHPGDAPIDWAQVAAAGVQGVIVKLTQGTTYLSPYGVADLMGARAAGLLIGAYHFAAPAVSTSAAESAWFLSSLGGITLDLGAWLDLEDLGAAPPHEVAPWAQDWLTAVATPDRPVGLYTDQSIYGQLIGAPWSHRLWLAIPGATGQSDAREAMTQTGQAEILGILGLVDVDTLWSTRGVNYPPSAAAAPPAAPPAPNPAPSPTTTGECAVLVPILAQGADGHTVSALQLILKGFDASILADGNFGPLTKAAVESYQATCHLVADGIVGPLTWGALLLGGAASAT